VRTNARIGEQAPRLRLEPLGVGDSDAEDAAALMQRFHVTLDPWQRLVLDAWLSRNERDQCRYMSCGLSVPRQSGKNLLIECREAYGLIVCADRVLHTAHLTKTSKKSFGRLAKFFTKGPKPVRDMVESIRRTNGEEAISLKNGGYIEYSARTRGASRGFDDISLVVYDEAQELTEEQVEAIMSTLAASSTGDRQLIYTGTPPGPNSPGDVFGNLRRAAIKGGGRVCWHEWSVQKCPPKSAEWGDVLDLVYETNPAMGIRLSEDFTREEFSTMSIDGFARERLGWWSEKSTASAVGRSEWDACAAAKRGLGDGRRTYGVKFSADGSQVAVAACLLREDGTSYTELIGVAPLSDGLSWLTDYLCDDARADRTAAVAVDGRNGADALIDRLRDTYPRQAIMLPGTKGVVSAATVFSEAVRDGLISHWPGADLDNLLTASVVGSVKRAIGNDGGWGFGGDGCTAAEAASIALWAAKNTRRDPEGGCVIL
jgi:hypothetical protein